MIPIGVWAPLDFENFLNWRGGGVCTPMPQDCTPLMLPYILAMVYNSYNACK